MSWNRSQGVVKQLNAIYKGSEMMLRIKKIGGDEEKQLYTNVLLGLNGLHGILSPDQYSVLAPPNADFLLSISFDDGGQVSVFSVSDSILDGNIVSAYKACILNEGQHKWSIGHVCFQLTVTK